MLFAQGERVTDTVTLFIDRVVATKSQRVYERQH
jgi:hypothetical protein